MKTLNHNEIYAKVVWHTPVNQMINGEIDTTDAHAAEDVAIQMSKVADVEVFLFRNRNNEANHELDSITVTVDYEYGEVYDFLAEGFGDWYFDEDPPVAEVMLEHFYALCPSLGYSHLWKFPYTNIHGKINMLPGIHTTVVGGKA